MDASELYDPEFRKLIKSKKPTIIIPVGSLEQHGAHLPITTDSDIVTEIASRLAKKCGFIVFPTISYGLSEEHSPLFNTSGSFNQFLNNIIASLVENKIKSIIILNGHHGNIYDLQQLDSMYNHPSTVQFEQGKLARIRFYSYWHFMKHEFDHGINKLSTQPGGFPKVAKNGVWGDPTGATKKDGEKFLAEIVRNLAKECQT